MLFFCKYEEHSSLLVDATDATDARKIATEEGEGEAPNAVIHIPPRGFAAYVWIGDLEDEKDEGVLVVSPLAHVDDMLTALETDDSAGATCGATADDDANEYTCTLPEGHAGEHAAVGPSGRVLANWEDT